MTDTAPRTTGGGLLGAFDGVMAGITEADVAAALADVDAPVDESPQPAGTATAAPQSGPAPGEPVTDAPQPATPRSVDPRAQAVADRLLGHPTAAPQPDVDRGEEPGPESARLVAAVGGATVECATGGVAVIGRADGDLVVPLGVVSRRHCQVSRLGDRYVVADLGSANGTLVSRPDGSSTEVTADPVELGPGDVIATARGRRPIARLEPAGGSA